MKPTLERSDLKQSVVTVQQPSETVTTRRNWSRCVTGIVVGVVSLTLIAGTVIASVYIGANIQKEENKAAWITFINKDNPSETITEKIFVTDTEADVTRPGAYRFIIDIKRDFLVIMNDREIEDGKPSACYLAEINQEVDIEGLKTEMTESRINRTISFENNIRMYKATGGVVNISRLSTKAQNMCYGRDVLAAEDVTALESFKQGKRSKRHKKKTTTETTYFWGLYKKKKTVEESKLAKKANLMLPKHLLPDDGRKLGSIGSIM